MKMELFHFNAQAENLNYTAFRLVAAHVYLRTSIHLFADLGVIQQVICAYGCNDLNYWKFWYTLL